MELEPEGTLAQRANMEINCMRSGVCGERCVCVCGGSAEVSPQGAPFQFGNGQNDYNIFGGKRNPDEGVDPH